jgi:hypothetical protein
MALGAAVSCEQLRATLEWQKTFYAVPASSHFCFICVAVCKEAGVFRGLRAVQRCGERQCKEAGAGRAGCNIIPGRGRCISSIAILAQEVKLHTTEFSIAEIRRLSPEAHPTV